MSYASGMGGVCTLIGTPPNLIISGLYADHTGTTMNVLVYGPGGYRFSDFMRIGLLMNLIILAANIFIVNIVYPLTPLP